MIEGRFSIEAPVRQGGMGEIFRAIDSTTGERVALKLQATPDEATKARFLREGKLLSDLSHPAIVRFIAHGVAGDGRMYLAMEWLDGEDLGQRLDRGALRPADALLVAQRTADALVHAHAHGVIHRDIKPSNLFLKDREIAQLRLLDFGVARASTATRVLTKTGLGLGSIGYMAPEQARGEKDLDARADIFSLGCVLYHCLTGSPVFDGDDSVAVLVKSLFEPAPRLKQTQPHLPEALDAFVSQMLEKLPADRPRDMAEVLRVLETLSRDPALVSYDAHQGAKSQRKVLTGSEQRLLWVVLARAAQPERTKDDTLITETGSVRSESLGELSKRYGAAIELPFDGSAVATLLGAGAATDQAAQAARLALEIKRKLPDHITVLTTGRGVVAGQSPVGEAVDRAVRLWRQALQGPTAHVVTDAVTAALLDGRFESSPVASGVAIVGERAKSATSRTLLGKVTPCVGRERELMVLEGLAHEAFDEPIARAVLVTAPAGVGKSRLRNEFLRRIDGLTASIWIGRGDPFSAGSAFAVLGEAVRAAFKGKPISDHLATLPGLKDPARVGEFLGELVGLKSEDSESVQLRAARQDSQLLGDQMQRAFEEWLRAECQTAPVVLVLEDLHWGDVPSVRFIDLALRNLHDCPLLVLALARPEVHDSFPRLWAERGAQEVRLSELTKKASEKLVREVLGKDTTEALVDRLVALSGGNAFYLEELIRQAAEGGKDSLPETVLAMLDGRLQALPAPVRQVLRAGSVFGRRFWAGGVAKLIENADDLKYRIDTLIASEFLSPSPDPRFTDEQELVFRHDLFREAAYATLSDDDKRMAHGIAGEWLEAKGASDAISLAEHFERGGEPKRAIGWYQRAAEDALAGNDLANALARAEKAISCGAEGEVRGNVLLLAAEARHWAGAFAEAEADATAALDLLPRGSDRWLKAVGELAHAAGVQGHVPALTRLLSLLPATHDAPVALASARLAEQLVIAGAPAEAAELVRRLEAIPAAVLDENPAVAGRVLGARASRERFNGDAEAYLALVEQAVAAFDRAGDVRQACMRRGNLGYAYLELGQHEKSVALLEEVIRDAERMGLQNVATTAKHNLGLALSRLSQFDRAAATERAAIEAFGNSGNRRMEGASHEYLALIHIAAGAFPEAERAANMAVSVAEQQPVLPLNRFESLAILALALLRQDRAVDAARLAKEAIEGLEALGGIDDGESLIRLVYAESLLSSGQQAAGRVALEAAKQRLLARAERIAAPALRASFLEAIPENKRTLELAKL